MCWPCSHSMPRSWPESSPAPHSQQPTPGACAPALNGRASFPLLTVDSPRACVSPPRREVLASPAGTGTLQVQEQETRVRTRDACAGSDHQILQQPEAKKEAASCSERHDQVAAPACGSEQDEYNVQCSYLAGSRKPPIAELWGRRRVAERCRQQRQPLPLGRNPPLEGLLQVGDRPTRWAARACRARPAQSVQPQ